MSSLPEMIPFGSSWPRVRPNRPRFQKLPSGLAIVADRQQPVLDGEPDAFFDQCPGDTWNAGAVSALPYKPFEIGDGCKRQGNGNAVGLGFFRGHVKS